MLETTSDLYLKPGTRKEKKLFAPSTLEPKLAQVTLPSKIVSDIAAIQRLFDTKISSFQLLFRASENGYSIREFHKKCDGMAGTVLLVET